MAAKDYEIVTGWANVYLSKKKKSTKRGAQTMSQDRRPITDGEILGSFEFYLRKWCERNKGETTMYVKKNGKEIYKATLIDKTEE